MLRRMPTDRSATTRLEPPYDTNGSGIPVSGARPTTAARLIAACPVTSAVMPAASREDIRRGILYVIGGVFVFAAVKALVKWILSTK